MKELINEVEKTIANELERIAEKHGSQYASLHEAYGVLAEEFEEALEKLENVKYYEKQIRYRLRIANTKVMMALLQNMADEATKAACELIQVAAVAVKAQRGFANERAKTGAAD